MYLQTFVCVSACLCKMVSASATSETQYWDTNSEFVGSMDPCLCVYHCLTILGTECWDLKEEYNMCVKKEYNICVCGLCGSALSEVCAMSWLGQALHQQLGFADSIPQLSLPSPSALESPGLAKAESSFFSLQSPCWEERWPWCIGQRWEEHI